VTSWSPQPCNLPAARSMHLAWASTVGRGGRASAHRDNSGAVWRGSSKKDLPNFGAVPYTQEVGVQTQLLLVRSWRISQVPAHRMIPTARCP